MSLSACQTKSWLPFIPLTASASSLCIGNCPFFSGRKSHLLFVSTPKTKHLNMCLSNPTLSHFDGGTMADDEKKFGKQILGRTVVSKSGKKFGMVGDVIFEARSGELIHIVLTNPTEYTARLELERDKESRMLIPFSCVIAVGDFVVVSEEDII